jgi:hypothetical protein
MAIAHAPDRPTSALPLVYLFVVLVALLALYLVWFDQGALSQGGRFLHELMHDGRHLMALPCH